MSSVPRWLLVIAAVAGLLAGCGGGDGRSPAAGPTTAPPATTAGGEVTVTATTDAPAAGGGTDTAVDDAVPATVVDAGTAADAAALALETVRRLRPGVVEAIGESAFGDAFATACTEVTDGESSGRTPDDTGRTIAAAVPDTDVLTGVDSFLFYGGCGDSLYAGQVRDQVLAELNRR